MPGEHRDETLLMADVGRKALRQVEVVVTHLLEERMPEPRAREFAHLLPSGSYPQPRGRQDSVEGSPETPIAPGLPETRLNPE